ncbi:MAG: Holliday junction endonuclease RuvC [Parcubacteria group bacterium Greene0714_21]|nr:MAG: Holliday junction endonuclease RuvC [Parcubacteria group bacterium Greene0416_39]TSC98340.1 MAG: Holliday junction endonuclease RuvC [Parcubacteria group bacterium Greene1014_47]TSD03990.1 MAG: Holliday junction endonuclease RuvC [Parcubacteria group bacterium Greene0714_21]
MIILGLDPGTASTGYGVVEKIRNPKSEIRNGLRCLEYGCLETPKHKTAGERFVLLEKALLRVLEEHKPDVAAVERLFFFKNLKTVMPVSEARGVLLLALARKKIPTIELSPLQVKMAITGYGRADKKQIQGMVKEILGLKEIPKPDDAADALALAIASSARDA